MSRAGTGASQDATGEGEGRRHATPPLIPPSGCQLHSSTPRFPLVNHVKLAITSKGRAPDVVMLYGVVMMATRGEYVVSDRLERAEREWGRSKEEGECKEEKKRNIR